MLCPTALLCLELGLEQSVELVERALDGCGDAVPWCITLDNSKGISRLRFWTKNSRVNGINDLPVFVHQGTLLIRLRELLIGDIARDREDAEPHRRFLENVTPGDQDFIAVSVVLHLSNE